MHDCTAHLLWPQREEHALGATTIGRDFFTPAEEIGQVEANARRVLPPCEPARRRLRGEWLAQRWLVTDFIEAFPLSGAKTLQRPAKAFNAGLFGVGAREPNRKIEAYEHCAVRSGGCSQPVEQCLRITHALYALEVIRRPILE
jgi:hypothetical protein